MKLHELEGSDYEDVFQAEISNFVHPERGVDGNDVAAAIILRDAERSDLLMSLYRREIRTLSDVDEFTRLEDLEFQAV